MATRRAVTTPPPPSSGHRRPVTPPTPDWEEHFRQQGYIRRVNSLGIVSFTDPNDPEWRWVRDPAGSGWTRYPWYLVDNPGGGQTPTGHQTRRTETGQLGREINATAAEGPIGVIYGETRVGGDVVAHASVSAESGNPYYCMWSLGHGELDSLQAMYLQFGATNQWLPVNPGFAPGYDYALYQFRPGSLTQTSSSYAAIAHGEHVDFLGPGVYQTWPGHAYVAGRFIYNKDYLHQPPQPRFLVRGRKIYDARLDPNLATPGFTATRNGTTVIYQATAANVLADYLSDTYFGFNLGDSGLLWEEWAEAAVYCDVLVAGEKRFQFNGRISRDASPEAIIEMMRAHCRAILRWRGNRLGIIINKPRSSVATFTKSTAVPVRGKRAGASQVPNAGILWWTNPNKDWTRDSVPIETENAKLGVDEIRRVEFALDNCTQPGQAARQLAYLFAQARANLDVTLAPTTTDAMEQEVGDRITYVEDVMGFGGSGIDLVIEEISDPQRGKRFFNCSLYDEAAFSDATGVVESRVPTSLSDPYGAVGVPTLLTLAEEVDEPQPGVFVPRIIITFTPASSPFIGGTKLSISVGGGAYREIGIFESGPVTHVLSEGAGKAVKVRAASVNRNTGLADASYLESSTLNTYDPNAPEPIGFIYTGTVDGESAAWWDKPPIRSTTLYGAGSWSASGSTAFTAANVNDGSAAAEAVTFNSAVAGHLQLDAGAAKEIREFKITFLDSADVSSFTIEFADASGGPYTAIGSTDVIVDTISSTIRRYVLRPSAAGSHRYWRVTKVQAVAYPERIAEVHPVEYTGTYPYTRGYRISGINPADAGYYYKDIFYTPTNATGKYVRRDEFKFVNTPAAGFGEPITISTTRDLMVSTISATLAISSEARRRLTFSSAGATTDSLRIANHYLVAGTLYVENNGGTIRHGWFMDKFGGSASAYLSPLNGPTTTLTNTPSVGAGTGFANAGGINAAFTSEFLFDTPVDQVPGSMFLHGVIAKNGTGAALIINACTVNSDVNGVTKTRPAFLLQHAWTGNLLGWSTTNIPAGTAVEVRFWGLIK